MFAMIALPVDQGNHSNQTITLALFPPYLSIESFFPGKKGLCVKCYHLVPDSACQ